MILSQADDVRGKASVEQFAHAVRVAHDRWRSSMRRGLNSANARTRKSWADRIKDEVIGALGEILCAEWRGLPEFKPSVDVFHTHPDILPDIEVRATELPTGSLIVRSDDHSDRRFVLAIVTGDGDVRLAGWIRGGDAMVEAFLRNPNNHRPSWFVPQEALMAMEKMR